MIDPVPELARAERLGADRRHFGRQLARQPTRLVARCHADEIYWRWRRVACRVSALDAAGLVDGGERLAEAVERIGVGGGVAVRGRRP